MNLIGELNVFLDRAESVKGDDERIAALLYDLEKMYDIPARITELKGWYEETPEAERILKTYRFILSLRSS